MSELDRAAADAWAAMLLPDTALTRAFGAGPMPVGLAIDMAQNATGERDDAVTALVGAAAAWLRDRTPPPPPPERGPLALELDGSCRYNATLVCDYLAAESGLASVHLGQIAETCQSPAVFMNDLLWTAGLWCFWVRDARRAIDLCRQVSAAAYPLEM